MTRRPPKPHPGQHGVVPGHKVDPAPDCDHPRAIRSGPEFERFGRVRLPHDDLVSSEALTLDQFRNAS